MPTFRSRPARSRLSTRCPRLDTPLLFPAKRGGFIDLDNWRRRDWRPSLEAAGLDTSLTPYAMRHTYASFALDAGVTIFELARLMGASVKVIDDTYGHLVRGSFDRVVPLLRSAPDVMRSTRTKRIAKSDQV
jgi:integrase